MGFKNFLILFLIIPIILFNGCNGDEPLKDSGMKSFQNKEHGFSFYFPDSWEEVNNDLPDRWAIKKNQDTVIFTVNNAEGKTLSGLAKEQLKRDMPEDPDYEDQLNIMTFKEKEWYTYAINYQDQGVNTIVSGTICNDKEINMVLVSNIASFEENRIIYSFMLESFRC